MIVGGRERKREKWDNDLPSLYDAQVGDGGHGERKHNAPKGDEKCGEAGKVLVRVFPLDGRGRAAGVHPEDGVGMRVGRVEVRGLDPEAAGDGVAQVAGGALGGEGAEKKQLI
jgi:hypothetical protein